MGETTEEEENEILKLRLKDLASKQYTLKDKNNLDEYIQENQQKKKSEALKEYHKLVNLKDKTQREMEQGKGIKL